MPASCPIRLATIADAEALASFAARTFHLGCPADTDPAHLNSFISTEQTPKRFRDFLVTDGVTMLVSELVGRLAGFTMLVGPSTHPMIRAKAPIEVRKFYVDPTHHGRGVANELMQAAIPILDGLRYDTAWLSVYSGNPRAIAFYQKWGFEIVGTHYFKVGGDRQKDFVMQRKRTRGTE